MKTTADHMVKDERSYFAGLQPGDVFWTPEGSICMKMIKTKDGQNAVSLLSGCTFAFDNRDHIVPLSAVLHHEPTP